MTMMNTNRREFLTGAFAAGIAAGASSFVRAAEAATDQTGSAENIVFKRKELSELRKKLDKRGKIGGVELSRIILGGNPFGGWAHCRDLSYVNTLVKAYNTHDKIMETLGMAEAAGINAFLTNPALAPYYRDYVKRGGRMKFISDCGGEGGPAVQARKSVEAGAAMVYIHGFGLEEFIAKDDWRGIRREFDEMRKLGVPVGIGAHAFGSLKYCTDHDLIPDFWMKTIHPTDYWSFQKTAKDAGEGEPGAAERGWYDNCWCRDPEALAAWFEKRNEPWIAFKTMAAGAVPPEQALPFAFEHGADYVCMGMMDFQIVDDVNIATAAFDRGFPNRRRAWH